MVRSFVLSMLSCALDSKRYVPGGMASFLVPAVFFRRGEPGLELRRVGCRDRRGHGCGPIGHEIGRREHRHRARCRRRDRDGRRPRGRTHPRWQHRGRRAIQDRWLPRKVPALLDHEAVDDDGPRALAAKIEMPRATGHRRELDGKLDAPRPVRALGDKPLPLLRHTRHRAAIRIQAARKHPEVLRQHRRRHHLKIQHRAKLVRRRREVGARHVEEVIPLVRARLRDLQALPRAVRSRHPVGGEIVVLRIVMLPLVKQRRIPRPVRCERREAPTLRVARRPSKAAERDKARHDKAGTAQAAKGVFMVPGRDDEIWRLKSNPDVIYTGNAASVNGIEASRRG